jgi:SH3 domain-containing YSC84-like protein 1
MMRTGWTSKMVMAAVAIPCFAASNPVLQRLDLAGTVLDEILQSPDSGVPQDLLHKSQCAVIVPGLKKGAFFVGGTYGKGFMTCRNENGMGWSAPAAIRMEGGGIGLQFGGSETDLVLLVMTEKGASRLMLSQFTFGGEGTVAAGPVGRQIDAQTDIKFTNDLYSWSRARGVFAGISISGTTMRQDQDDNETLYGKKYTTAEVIHFGLATPAEGSKLFSLLNRESSQKLADRK